MLFFTLLLTSLLVRFPAGGEEYATEVTDWDASVDIQSLSDLTCLGKYVIDHRDLPGWGNYDQPIYALLDYNTTESRFELTVMYHEVTRWKGLHHSQCIGFFELEYPMSKPPLELAAQDFHSVYLRSFIQSIVGLYPSALERNVSHLIWAQSLEPIRFWFIAPLDNATPLDSYFDQMAESQEAEPDVTWLNDSESDIVADKEYSSIV